MNLSRLFNRSAARPAAPLLPSGGDVERLVAQHNRWRDHYNPLRSLSMAQAVAWLEQAQRGEYADCQWAYAFIERRDPDLLALVERRTGALVQLDWDVRTVEESRARGRYDEVLAQDQATALRETYDSFENLYEAVEHLGMATFRGYAHVQAVAEGKLLQRLNCLEQWNVLRDGYAGAWYWNPEAAARMASGLAENQRLNPACYLIRTHKRPVNEVALIKYLRQNLSCKDWDAFLEIYGIPGWIIVMPPNIPAGQESVYKDAAQDVAEGGSGALPNGSDAKAATPPAGTPPFRDHLDYWTEKLVLAGTGGLLTMLSMPQGIGAGAAPEHDDAFQTLARAEAREISELFQKSIDKLILAQHFPGQPALAYWQLAANEEQDVGEILDHALKISQAGGQPDWDEISEKTGYTISAAPAPAAPVAPGMWRSEQPAALPALPNRAAAPATLEEARRAIVASGIAAAAGERAALVDSWLSKIEQLGKQPNLAEAQYLDAVETLVREMPAELLTPEAIAWLAGPLEAAMGAATVNALVDAAATLAPPQTGGDAT